MSKGKSIVEFYNLLPLDAAAIGNHEFDFGPDVPDRIEVLPGEDGMGNLKARVHEARFPWLSSNIIVDPVESCIPGPKCNALGQRTIFEPRTILTRAGKKIGVIGATTVETPDITLQAFIQGAKFEALLPVVQAEAKFLREKEHCDYVFLTAHEGLHQDESGKYLPGFGIAALMQNLSTSSLDAVIAGHIHVKDQEVIHGIPVMQEGRSAWVVGVLHLWGKGNSKQFRFEPFIDIPASAVEPDVTAVLKPYRDAAQKYKSMIVGKTSEAFPADHDSESALGNMIADAVHDSGQEHGGAQFALMNAGGIRNDLPAGEITYEDIYSVMPFDNNLVVAELTGSQLLMLLEISTSGDEGMPGVSGLRLRVLDVTPGVPGKWDRDLNGDGKKETWERDLLVDAYDLNGRQIQPDTLYKVATNSYLSGGGDYQKIVYDQVAKARLQQFSALFIRDVIVEYIKRHPLLIPEEFFSERNRRIELIKPSENKSSFLKQDTDHRKASNSYTAVVRDDAEAGTRRSASHSLP
jgi:5'-nucleotidase